MTVRSETKDPFAIKVCLFLGLGAILSILTLLIPGLLIPAPLGAVASVVALLAWLGAMRPVVEVDDAGIRGLTWGRKRIGWHAMRSASVTGDLLQVVPNDPLVYSRSPHSFFRHRRGRAKNALVALLDPATTGEIAVILANKGLPPAV
jgi:hypothetical protein